MTEEPTRTLLKSHWQALAMAYQAGAEGVPITKRGNYGGIALRIWAHLQNKNLVEERKTDERLPHWAIEYRIYITDQGWEYYQQEHNRYQAIYPDV